MRLRSIDLVVAIIALTTSAPPPVASAGSIVRASSVGDALSDPSLREKMGEIIARQKASGASDGRIRVIEGPCANGMPTCYDGPSNTIFIADDPTKYMYKTVPQAGQPSLYPYSWARAVFHESQKAYLWWVKEKREGFNTAAYDSENVLPLENEHFWQKKREPHCRCAHSAAECLELKN
jgi:hypothetical protein